MKSNRTSTRKGIAVTSLVSLVGSVLLKQCVWLFLLRDPKSELGQSPGKGLNSADAEWQERSHRGRDRTDEQPRNDSLAVSHPSMPDKVLSKSTAVICCIVRDEEAYLHEWIDYNLGIGFDHVYVYDNSPDFDLENWSHRDTTVWHYPGVAKQHQAYWDCVKRFGVPRNHRWVAFFDADEFLVLYQHDTVKQFLEKHCPVGSIAINWNIMSWSQRLQYAPLPVTQRFQYVSHVDKYVKCIVYLPDLDLSIVPNIHYQHLKPDRPRVDTRNHSLPVNSFNYARPSDVALLYHFHTKSWKEYVAKRQRGVAFQKQDVGPMVQEALRGKDLTASVKTEGHAWHRMKSACPQYRFFDETPGATIRGAQDVVATDRDMAYVICTGLYPDDEFYIDEWLDYHLSLGFSHIVLYDFSERNWMRQWHDENTNRSEFRKAHVSVTFANESTPSNALIRDCTRRMMFRFRDKQELQIVHLSTFEFVVLKDGSSMVDVFERDHRDEDCSLVVPVFTFGTSNRSVFEPLPVTKRFNRRIDEIKGLQKEFRVYARLKEQSSFLSHESLNQTEALVSCPLKSASQSLSVYRYTRSRKECRKLLSFETNDTGFTEETCKVPGSSLDNSAWLWLKERVPFYSNYDHLSW